MKILDTIGAALRGPKAPDSRKLAELLAEAKASTVAARARLAELDALRSDKVWAPEKERTEFRAALLATQEEIKDGEAAIDALSTRHAATVANEAEDVERQRYDTAKAQSGELGKLIASYEKHARAVVETVRRIAEIDTTVAAVNDNLPADARRLLTSDELRAIPPQLREVVSEKHRDLWTDPGALHPLPPALQSEVEVDGEGRGYLSAHGRVRYLEKRRFSYQQVRAATDTVRAPGFHELNLPAAKAGQPPIFKAPYWVKGWVRPADILASIEATTQNEKGIASLKIERPLSEEVVAI